MQNNICGIILKVSYPSMGDTSKIEILGKTMLEWVTLALGDGFAAAVDFSDRIPLPALVKPHIKQSDYTAVLFSDTPLITKKTVLDAVYELKRSGENVLKMTRGYIFKTSFLMLAEKVYGGNHRFFDEEDFLTAFSFKQAAMVTEVLRNRIINYHMSQGVQFADPASAFIGCDAVIERGVIIGPDNTVSGKTVIRQGARLERGNTLDSCVIDENCKITSSVITQSYIGRGVTVGPFAHIRPGSKIGHGCKVGNFVEIKNSVLGEKTKVSHLTYVGDAEIGENCNIGCGTVFCNYDGNQKHKAIVGNNVFIGSNSNLIAPVTVADNAFIAAGSTINKDVPECALAIARARQENKEGWRRKP